MGADGQIVCGHKAAVCIVDTAVISEDKVVVKGVAVDNGGVRLAVGIDGLPVGENAQAECLEKVFGVTGAAAPADEFSVEKVTYKGDMTNNRDGTVSYTAEPKVEDGEAKPDAFFFKATVVS